jgi:molybdopterin-binding protein
MLDAKLILCEDYDLPDQAAAASTDIVDVGAYETALGEEEHIRLRVEMSVTATSAGAATLKVEAAHDTVAPIDASSIVFASSEIIALADLVKGLVLIDAGLPVVHGRIIGVYITGADADFTAGQLNAYLYVR